MFQKLSRDSWVLIAFSSLRKLTDVFVGAFLVAYIMRLATNDIVAVSIFRLVEYWVLAFGSILIAHLCKAYNKVFVFGLHLVAYVVLMAALIMLGDNVIEQLFLIGTLYGVAELFYRFPFNLMVTEKVVPHQMARFISIKSAWRNAVSIIAPTVLGIFITIGSFVDMARVMLIIICLEFGLLFMFGRSRHRDSCPIDFSGFTRRIMRFPIIRHMFLAEVLRGFADLMGTTVTMYTIYLFHTDLNLGFFTTAFAICTIIVSTVYSHFSHHQHFAFVAQMCVLGFAVGVGSFCAAPGQITYFMYGFVYATAANIIYHICDAVMFNLGQSHLVTNNFKSEYLTLREISFCTGRWAALIALLYIGVFGGVAILRWGVLVMGIALILSTQISVAVSRHLRER